jgi:hypothetical protein
MVHQQLLGLLYGAFDVACIVKHSSQLEPGIFVLGILFGIWRKYGTAPDGLLCPSSKRSDSHTWSGY